MQISPVDSKQKKNLLREWDNALEGWTNGRFDADISSRLQAEGKRYCANGITLWNGQNGRFDTDIELIGVALHTH